jgi:hypothetical protein
MSAFNREERRKHERKRVQIRVDFADGDSITTSANSRDIGLGGLYVLTDAEVQQNSLLKVTIDLPEGRFESDAVVVYVDEGCGFGVRFKNLSEENEKLLRRSLDLK